MGYAIDRRLIRLTGDLLAAGTGTFTAADARQLFRGALNDNVLTAPELAAILVVHATVARIADAEAARLLDNVARNSRNDDPDLEPWIVGNLSGQLLRRAAPLIAGRKRRPITRSEVTGLMSDAYQGGKSEGISRDEALAFLVIRELLQNRMAADAQQTLDKLCAAIHEDGVTLGNQGSTTDDNDTPGGRGRQCGACSGSGYQTCGSCGGYGYHTRNGTRTRYDGSTEYYQERVPCSCNSGRLRCGRCAGSGRV
jgi:hypothetical protein